jgi:hypothetical protein
MLVTFSCVLYTHSYATDLWRMKMRQPVICFPIDPITLQYNVQTEKIDFSSLSASLNSSYSFVNHSIDSQLNI